MNGKNKLITSAQARSIRKVLKYSITKDKVMDRYMGKPPLTQGNNTHAQRVRFLLDLPDGKLVKFFYQASVCDFLKNVYHGMGLSRHMGYAEGLRMVAQGSIFSGMVQEFYKSQKGN